MSYLWVTIKERKPLQTAIEELSPSFHPTAGVHLMMWFLIQSLPYTLIQPWHHFEVFIGARKRRQLPNLKWEFPKHQATYMLIHFLPDFALCKINQDEQKSLWATHPSRVGRESSWKVGYTKSHSHWQKKHPKHESSTCKYPEQLEKENLAPSLLLLYVLSPLILLLSLKVTKSEIFWKRPKCPQHFYILFAVFHFVWKHSVDLWKTYCIALSKSHREMFQQQQNITKICRGNFHPKNGTMSPFSPVSRDMQT